MNRMNVKVHLIAVSLAVCFTFVSCGKGKTDQANDTKSKPEQTSTKVKAVTDLTQAVALLNPTDQSQVHGVVRFEKVPEGLKITGLIEGLTPGKHGFHIHEFGDCSAPDGSSAGGHFNPTGMKHGAPTDSIRHVGDLGNIVADAQGRVELNMVDSQIALDGENSILSRGVVVHAGADDLTSQPSGNAGSRVACGVIESTADMAPGE